MTAVYHHIVPVWAKLRLIGGCPKTNPPQPVITIKFPNNNCPLSNVKVEATAKINANDERPFLAIRVCVKCDDGTNPPTPLDDVVITGDLEIDDKTMEKIKANSKGEPFLSRFDSVFKKNKPKTNTNGCIIRQIILDLPTEWFEDIKIKIDVLDANSSVVKSMKIPIDIAGPK